MKRRKKQWHIIPWIIFLEVVIVIVGIAYLVFSAYDGKVDQLLEQPETLVVIEETETEEQKVLYVPEPDIDEQLLTVNEWSRPGKKCEAINYLVIHYLANPKTTAQENRDYFESLKELKNTSMSANYVVGIDGEIIRCVPDGEIAFASNEANKESISIENCHLDDTGKLTAKTYESLVHLAAYLTEKYDLDRNQIIRHYDVTGKECPKYYVEHEDMWETFKDDVMEYREACKEEVLSKQTEPEPSTEVDELTAYLEKMKEEDSEKGE